MREKLLGLLKRSVSVFMIPVITAVVGAAAGAVASYYLTKNMEQNAIVESLSTRFDFVDASMSYEQALQTLYEESREKDQEISSMNQQITRLSNQISVLEEESEGNPIFEYKNTSLIMDGLKIEDNINRSILLVGSHLYYSDNIIDKALKNKLSYDDVSNAVLYSPNGDSAQMGMKTDLFDANVLYGGDEMEVFTPSDGKTFSMGSNTYNKGFILHNPYTSYYENDVIALFDLQKKYSKMTFDLGRLNGYNIENATLKIFLDGTYTGEIALDGSLPPQSTSIDLNYANSMKLELVSGRVGYGFANIVLES